MIGGAPYLMASLERALDAVMIQPVYSFSVRESVEAVQRARPSRLLVRALCSQL